MHEFLFLSHGSLLDVYCLGMSSSARSFARRRLYPAHILAFALVSFTAARVIHLFAQIPSCFLRAASIAGRIPFAPLASSSQR